MQSLQKYKYCARVSGSWNSHGENHSCSQKLRSFLSALRIMTCCGKVQHWTSAIHGLPVTLRMLRVKSDKSDWLRIRKNYSAHDHKIGPSWRSRFLVLTKKSAVSGNENGRNWLMIELFSPPVRPKATICSLTLLPALVSINDVFSRVYC